jgi:hypothetical protein
MITDKIPENQKTNHDSDRRRYQLKRADTELLGISLKIAKLTLSITQFYLTAQFSLTVQVGRDECHRSTSYLYRR